MTRIHRSIFLLVFTIFSGQFSPATAQTQRYDFPGFDEFFRSLDARSLGKSNAIMGSRAGILSDYWNPAVLAWNKDQQFAAAHNHFLPHYTYSCVAFSAPKDSSWTIGGSFFFMNSETQNMPQAGKKSRLVPKSPSPVHDLVISISAGYQINRYLSAGTRVTNIIGQMYDKRDINLFFNYGFMFIKNDYSLGLAIHNAAPKISNLDGDYHMKSAISFGGTHYTTDYLQISGSVFIKQTANIKQSLGFEMQPVKYVDVRAGLELDLAQKENDFAPKFFAGLGLNFFSFQLNYAFTPNRFLHDVHHVSLQFSILKKRRTLKKLRLYVQTFSDVITPNNDGVDDDFKMGVLVENEEKMKQWKILIMDKNKNVIKDWYGVEHIPDLVTWDCKTYEGNHVPSGRYSYLVQISHQNNSLKDVITEGNFQVLAPVVFTEEKDNYWPSSYRVPDFDYEHIKLLIENIQDLAVEYDSLRMYKNEKSYHQKKLEVQNLEKMIYAKAEKMGYGVVRRFVNNEQTLYDVLSNVEELKDIFAWKRIYSAWNGRLVEISRLHPGQVIVVLYKFKKPVLIHNEDINDF